MSPLQIFNTLTAKKEDFIPASGKTVHMYACGPTVYDLCHLGHARMAIVFDVVQRYLRYSGYDVTFVRNITDVDDKIINRAREIGIRPEQLARENIFTFWRDMHALNVAPPDVEPRATEYIGKMIEFTGGLIKSGHAYESSGDVYFSVATFSGYGKLKKQNLDDLISGARDQVRSQEELKEFKRTPFDFALWKRVGADDTGWESPWGFGRPGWHLECSTMIKNVLGETIDIHGGGEDLVFPHHENEIAQSEALHGKPLARYWIHNSFVQIDAEKMSKSLGNYKTIQDLLSNYSPDTLRLLLLQTHYRSPIEFTAESLSAAQHGMQRLIRAANSISDEEARDLTATGAVSESEYTRDVMAGYESEFTQAMNSDFNTAAATAVLFNIADKVFLETEASRRLSHIFALNSLSQALGLTLDDFSHQVGNSTASGIIDLLLEIRTSARSKKDFATSDLIRDRLTKLGVKVNDTAGGGATWELV